MEYFERWEPNKNDTYPIPLAVGFGNEEGVGSVSLLFLLVAYRVGERCIRTEQVTAAGILYVWWRTERVTAFNWEY